MLLVFKYTPIYNKKVTIRQHASGNGSLICLRFVRYLDYIKRPHQVIDPGSPGQFMYTVWCLHNGKMAKAPSDTILRMSLLLSDTLLYNREDKGFDTVLNFRNLPGISGCISHE